MLYDRVATGDNRPQRFGSAFVCKDQKRVLAPLEDPEQVDVWRKTMGFPLTVEENAAHLRTARAPRPSVTHRKSVTYSYGPLGSDHDGLIQHRANPLQIAQQHPPSFDDQRPYFR